MDVQTIIINGEQKITTYVSSRLLDTLYYIIKQTYFGADTITIENPTDVPCREIADFLTYILAYPKDTKTPKVKVNKCNNININISKHIGIFSKCTMVCYSGGIDSTGALLKEIDENKNPIALWCDYGQPYRLPEKLTVEKICRRLSVPLIEASLDLSDFIAVGGERFGHVFPARNLLIAAICLCFNPKEIVLAGLCDELTVPDKSIRMYNEFIDYFGVNLYSPFVKMTKTEVLCVWKKKWNKYLDARETVSCYSDNGNCQDCSSCAKREVALVGAQYSYEYPVVFTNQHELIEEHWFSRIDSFQYERRTDMLIALEMFTGKLTPKLQNLVNFYCKKYADEISKRKYELEYLSLNS